MISRNKRTGWRNGVLSGYVGRLAWSRFNQYSFSSCCPTARKFEEIEELSKDSSGTCKLLVTKMIELRYRIPKDMS